MLSPQRLEYHYPAVVVCQQAPQATRTRFCKQTQMTSHSDVSRTKPQRWIIIVIAVCNNASWWFTLYLLGLHLKLWASLSFSLAGHITRIMFGLKMIILFIRLSCLWNFVTLWDLEKKKKNLSLFHLCYSSNTWDLKVLHKESVNVEDEIFLHGKQYVKQKEPCLWFKLCRSVFQAFWVSIFGPEFLHSRVKRATEQSGEMDGGRWGERSEGYSLTEWRLMSLFCLAKPLLIPPGLWMFRDVSDMNKRCQSSAVTFDWCHLVVLGPALWAGTSSILIQQWKGGSSVRW